MDEEIEHLLNQISSAIRKSRIWGGTDWHYNPLSSDLTWHIDTLISNYYDKYNEIYCRALMDKLNEQK